MILLIFFIDFAVAKPSKCAASIFLTIQLKYAMAAKAGEVLLFTLLSVSH